MQLGLRDKLIDMGHARALLAIDDPTLQLKLYNEILAKGLSVRKVEEIAKSLKNQSNKPAKKEDKNKNSRFSNKDFDILKVHLSQRFETPVDFVCDNNGKGKITFPFKNDDELERLITIFDNIKGNDN